MREIIDINYNMLLDNLNKTVYPPYFINQADFLKDKRTQRAINARISIGGKLFCWHDWTFISQVWGKTAFEIGTSLVWYEYLCTKCGKDKRVPHERLLENLLN